MVSAMEDEAIPELTVPEVAARLGQPGFHVYDNNGPARWKRSHVPGAKNLNAYSFDASELPEDTTATLVFYCSGPG
jgi:rhodanese-related sulfurtransferase